MKKLEYLDNFQLYEIMCTSSVSEEVHFFAREEFHSRFISKEEHLRLIGKYENSFSLSPDEWCKRTISPYAPMRLRKQFQSLAMLQARGLKNEARIYQRKWFGKNRLQTEI